VNDIIAMVESGQFENPQIYITPPDGVQTDEDSADEDQGGLIDNLNGRQLQAEAEAVVRTGQYYRRHIGDDSDDDGVEQENDSEDEEPVTKRKKQTVTADAGKKRAARKWCNSKSDLSESTSETFGANSQSVRPVEEDMTPTMWFEQFFSDDLVQLLVDESISYAKFRGNHQFTVNSDEIRAFLAVLILSSYTSLPRRRMYWEQAADCHNQVAAILMTRNRFDEVMRYMHLADNNRLNKDDKFAKLRPLFDSLNKSFLARFCHESHLSVDESMVPYFGHHGCKQFIRGKPIRFGYKLWCLNTTLGYLVQFQAYQGKGSVTDQQLGLGGSVVVDLIHGLPEGLKYNLYFDNFFTSMQLLDHLTARGVGATGTLRANRTDKCPLITPADMKKKDRGHMDHRCDSAGNIVVIRWHDNSPVTIASNVYGVQPVDKVRRWSSAAKKEIQIPQPAAIRQYNAHMGGTDRMDQNVGSYRITIRSKKWWWPLFIHMVDVSLQNAFYLYKRSPAYCHLRLDLLGFKREIVHVYSQRYAQRANVGVLVDRAQRSGGWRVSAEVRLDRLDHLPVYVDKQKQCDVCKKKANFVCQKCTSGGAPVGLHPKDCFLRYHTE